MALIPTKLAESPYETASLLAQMSKVVDELSTLTDKLQSPFPLPPDLATGPREVHNLYTRALFACYISKYRELVGAVIDAEKDSNFLVYALSGRALLETTATLRYYVEHQYRPLFDKGEWGQAELQELIKINDRHLRGSRFSWDLFLKRDFVALAEQERDTPPTHSEPSINVNTCFDKWAREEPHVKWVYALFCDLVHPNIGSTLLVASSGDAEIHFVKGRGTPVGRTMLEATLPFISGFGVKPSAKYLLLLLASMWQDDELQSKV